MDGQYVTKDKSLFGFYEHTVGIKKDENEIFKLSKKGLDF